MNKRFFIILLVLIIPLTGCPLWSANESDLDKECIYERNENYKSKLPFSMPLFYKELESYEYNGIEMEGFYFLGETEGRTTPFETPGSPKNQTFLINDKYNLLTYIEMDKNEMDNVESLYSDKIGYIDKEYLDDNLEENIISNLVYEYYQENFIALNEFLETNNALSFWDLEQMNCSREDSISSIPLSHPNINEYISLRIIYELTDSQRIVIAKAIENNNLSLKENESLKLLIEELITTQKVSIRGLNVILAWEVESANSYNYITLYEENGDKDFYEDIVNMVRMIFSGLQLNSTEFNDYVNIYSIVYEDGVQVMSFEEVEKLSD